MLEKRKKNERLRENTSVIACIPITINVEVVQKLHDHLLDMTLQDKMWIWYKVAWFLIRLCRNKIKKIQLENHIIAMKV